MLENLNKEQLKLSEYMSELSELAYTARWMDKLEFSLWNAMNHKITEYGRLVFTQKIIDNLRELSNKAGGWIVFDEKQEETFLTWQEWNKLNK
jgi:hypothetical protein